MCPDPKLSLQKGAYTLQRICSVEQDSLGDSLMSSIDLVSKNLLANCFRNFRTRNN